MSRNITLWHYFFKLQTETFYLTTLITIYEVFTINERTARIDISGTADMIIETLLNYCLRC